MNQFIHGDCLDVMPSIDAGSVDLIVTDPPYLVNYRDRSGRSIANDQESAWLAPAFAQMYRVLRNHSFCVSFYGWTKVDVFFEAWKRAGFRVVGHLVFTKPYASRARFVRYQHESAFLLAKGSPAAPIKPIPDVLPWHYTGNRLHPTQKPVSALAPLIRAFSQPDDLVLDPFAGSASTCVAAVRLGRRFLGIEMDAQYHEVGQARLARLAPMAVAA